MDKRKEGKPGEARAALRRSVRDNGSVFATLIHIVSFFHKSIKTLSNMIMGEPIHSIVYLIIWLMYRTYMT